MHQVHTPKRKGGNFTIEVERPRTRNGFRRGTRVVQDRRRRGTRGARKRQALAG